MATPIVQAAPASSVARRALARAGDPDGSQFTCWAVGTYSSAIALRACQRTRNISDLVEDLAWLRFEIADMADSVDDLVNQLRLAPAPPLPARLPDHPVGVPAR